MQAGKSQDVIYEKLTGNISSDNFLNYFKIHLCRHTLKVTNVLKVTHLKPIFYQVGDCDWRLRYAG